MKKLIPVLLLFILSACMNSNPYIGSWMMEAHDAINEGEKPGVEPDSYPFVTLAITPQEVFIDSKSVSHRFELERDLLFLTIDNIEHEFTLGEVQKLDGQQYFMMTSFTYTPKHFSSYYFKKIK